MMKTFFLLFILGVITPHLLAQTTVIGVWKAYEKGKPSTLIQVYRHQDNTYRARMIQLLDKELEQKKCHRCHDERKGKPYRQLVIIKGLKISKDKKSAEGGEILDPATGKEYNCKVWLEGNALKMRAYAGVFYATRTWKWVRKQP